jgi:hypothetical protein
LLEFIINDNVLHYVIPNPNQHGITKSESTVTNFVTCLDFMAPVIRSQRQTDAVYSDLSNAFDLLLHNLLLHKLGSFGFSDGYVSWFRSYLTNRQSRVRVFRTLSLQLPECRKALSWGFFFLTYSLMNYVTQLTILNF